MSKEKYVTLIEKLEQELARNCRLNNWDLRFKAAINTVEQHSDWMPVSEEIPVLEHECGFRSFEPTNFYQIIDNEGCLHNAYFSTNRYANDVRALFTLCELSLYNGKWIVDDEYEVITVDMVKFWKQLQFGKLGTRKNLRARNG